MVIAQARGGFGGGPGGHADIPPAVWAVIGVIILVALAIGITIQVFYLLTMSRCYSRIAPRNRRMEPGLVWLNLIPCFANIWIFFTTIRLADSLQAEFRWRRLRGDGDFGRTLGITYPILALLGVIPYLGALCSLASLVCWIIYWVKVAGYSRELLADANDRAAEDEYDDDQDWERRAEQV
jgi:hypothetical protein